jgi:glycosyltransferase involved in cell wall biosynthesis
MHDLCSEALITKVRAKKALWRIIDRKALRDAWMVIVPTEEFAEHYRSRGIDGLWVLPHCLPTGLEPSAPRRDGGALRFIYSGNVYEPHEDAIAAIIKATRDLSDVEVVFQSNPHPLLRDQSARWMSRREAMSNLHEADVFLVALGSQTPYPQEIHCCFPSKITDYLAVGRPILAVVPPGCFVDRFIRETGCGLVVNTLDAGAIREAIERLRDCEPRKKMTEAARQVAGQIEPDYWFAKLRQCLVFGPPYDSSSPPFPAASLAPPKERGLVHDLTRERVAASL